jgi:phage regulator Rha-like protein
MKKDKIVQVYEDVPRAGTFLIAQGFDREHKMVTRLIEKYRTDFEDFGTLKVRKVITKGRPAIEFWLNEEQALLLGTYMRNNDIVREFKKKLIREFKALRDQVNNHRKHTQHPAYQITRDAGKIVRRQTTDVMKRFVEYATKQGSNNSDRYYSNITRMLNGLLFIVNGKFKNLRNVMSVQQLMTVSSAEQIIDKGLLDGMNKKKYYKDIYQDIKKRVMIFAELHGQSEVISKQLEIGLKEDI